MAITNLNKNRKKSTGRFATKKFIAGETERFAGLKRGPLKQGVDFTISPVDTSPPPDSPISEGKIAHPSFTGQSEAPTVCNISPVTVSPTPFISTTPIADSTPLPRKRKRSRDTVSTSPATSPTASEKSPNEDTKIPWNEGRRIVELGTLAERLGYCDNELEICPGRLDLRNCVEETRIGLASILWITCLECGELNRVCTSKTHVVPGKKRKIYDVNTKHASAIIHSGIGSSSIGRYFASTNIPPVDVKTTKRREREIGPQIERQAQDSCRKSLEEEIQLTPPGDEDSLVNLTASFDMGWQCKGSGKSYNSKSGHAALIGKNNGKIVNYTTRITNCKQCEVNKDVPHDCRMNWGGSSKAMEGDAAVDLLNRTKSSSYQVSTIINDEDSTTMARIATEVDHPVKKNSDVNHCKKTVGNDLYKAKAKNKEFGRLLSVPVINHVKECFSYAITQNQDKPAETKSALQNIVPHLYNDHTNCGEWCTHKTDHQAKFKSLPHGNPLMSTALREELTPIINKQANNATNLCANASSNSNESFNMTVAAKAPKTKHYSKSETLDYRISAAVCQKNVGEGYLPLVYEGMGLSPGRVTKILASRFDKNVSKRRVRQATKAYKHRRLNLKQQNYSSAGQKELREGVTYQSSVCLEGDNLADSYTISIPSMMIQPESRPIPPADLLDTQLIDTVPSVNTETALQRFAEWLQNTGNSVLVAHNAEKFDSRHLWRIIRCCKLESAFSSVVGFADSLPLFRAKFPNEKNHKLGDIHRVALAKQFAAHNAMDDVFALIDVLQVIQVKNTSLADYTFKRKYIDHRFEFLTRKQQNLLTLQTLVAQKVLSSGMAEKMAASGLKFSHLEIVFQRGGVNGLKDLCTEKFGGKCRVTADKRILSTLGGYFENKQSVTC